jgi:phosphatidylinositol alpha-mannosyltransferase
VKIGLVCPYDMGAPGGVQQLVHELGEHLRQAGEEVVVVAAGTTTFDGGPGRDEPTIPTGGAISIRGNRSRAPLTLSPASWRRVRSALGDVDVVNVHEPLIPLVGWAGLRTGKPTIATFHADPPSWARRLYHWLPLGSRLFRSMKLTAVSQTAADAIPPAWGEVEIIPNAIDVGSFDLPVGRISSRVAFLGRDEPRKGLDVLLDAWPDIQASRPDAELIVMGADRGIPPPGVTYLGPVTGGEKRRVLASSSVYAAPNTGGESFGIVVAEGMAAGCAVVASNLGSFRDVLGETGRLIPVGDPMALANAISELLADPAEARRLCELARSRSSRFDWGGVVERYRYAYANALR